MTTPNMNRGRLMLAAMPAICAMLTVSPGASDSSSVYEERKPKPPPRRYLGKDVSFSIAGTPVHVESLVIEEGEFVEPPPPPTPFCSTEFSMKLPIGREFRATFAAFDCLDDAEAKRNRKRAARLARRTS